MPPEDAVSFSKTLELGKELANNLPDYDLLSRWMAHYIADLITRAESAAGSAAEEIRRETATTILELWAQRANLDEPRRPLANFGPVFKALERLSAPQQPWHFYRLFDGDTAPGADDLASIPLLGHALTLEDVARRVVQQTVRFAAQEALTTEAKWLHLTAHLPDGQDTSAARAMLAYAESSTSDTTSQAEPTGDLTNAGQRLVATLRSAESDLRTVRLALEAAFADDPEATT